MGPTSDGRYLPVEITSIQRNRAPCIKARAGQAASLSLDGFPPSKIRKVWQMNLLNTITLHVFKSQCGILTMRYIDCYCFSVTIQVTHGVKSTIFCCGLIPKTCFKLA